MLRIRDVRAGFTVDGALAWAVRGVDLDLGPGERLGLVGESGSGKTALAHALLRLGPARVEGRVELDGVDLLALPDPALRAVRGRKVAMVFQEPMTSLNPVHTVGAQVAEVLQLHLGLDRATARARAAAQLAAVGVGRPDDYPHQLSGGMRQRVMIAMALACDPQVLVADEPTTALDVTTQAQIVDLIDDNQRARGMSVLWISHDLPLVSQICDRVAVMYGGRVQEEAPVGELFARPSHPYTQGLLACLPERATRGVPLPVIPGQVPSLRSFPSGCRFSDRCALANARCRAEEPEITDLGGGHRVRCHEVTA